MEVLVSRKSKSRKRASRALIGVLATTIVIGSVFYFNKPKNSDAAETVVAPDAPSIPVASVAGQSTDVTVMPAPKKPEPEKPTVAPAVTPIKTATPTGPATPGTVAPVIAPGSAPIVSLNSSTPMVSTPGLPKVDLTKAIALNTEPTTKPTASVRPTPMQSTPISTINTAPAAPATLAGAKAKADAGQLLAARNEYNTVLTSGKLSPTDATSVKSALVEINKTVVFSPRRFADDTWAGSYVVKSGDRLQKIANENSVTWEFLCKINGMSDQRKLRAGQTLKLLKGPFHGVVSKSTFMLDVYLGNPGGPGSLYVTSFPVGLGSDDSTPTGTWQIKSQSKLRNPTYYSPKEEGDRIITADDPKNPLGEFWMGLVGLDGHAVGKESYGIHGTIEPETIGKMASMGCIRLLNENVAQVFDLMVETKSTVVIID